MKTVGAMLTVNSQVHGAKAMTIGAIVTFWRGQQKANENGLWAHDLDRELLKRRAHTFNLDYPVSPYVGDIANAPVIILGANAGFDPTLTPSEFPNTKAYLDYVDRVDNPGNADWKFVSRYYERTNYGKLLSTGHAALINVCAYRSPRLSAEPDNRKIMNSLPSVVFARKWLVDSVMPMASQGERLIIAKRHGQWRTPPTFREAAGVAIDPAPVSPQITRVPYEQMMRFLEAH